MGHDGYRSLIAWAVIGLFAFAAVPAFAQASDGAPPTLALGPESVDFVFPEPTSILNLYRAWGDLFGIEVLFDPRIKEHELHLELHETTAAEILRILTLSVGHFAVAVDGDTVFVADDTPQNRRTYTPQVIQPFVLEDLASKDAMTILRSLVGIKHITVREDLNTIVIRDGIDTARVIQALLQIVDKPRAEAAIDVEIFHLAARQRDRVLERLQPGGDRGRRLPQRLTSAQLAELRDATQLLATPTLSVFSGETGRVLLEDSWTLPVAEGVAHLSIGLDLAVTARVKAASDAVEIEGKLTAREVTDTESVGPVTGTRTTQWRTQLGQGQSFLLSGFLATGRKSVTRGSDSLLVSFFGPSAEDRGEILIALTPRIIRKPGYGEQDLKPLCIGTEAHLKLCGTW